MIDELAVVKRACDIAGITAPEDLTSELYKGVTAADLYRRESLAGLALHPWSFAQTLVQLAQIDGAPIIGYSYLLQIPTEDLIIAADRITNQPTNPYANFTDYQKFGNLIHTDEPVLWAVIRRVVGPHLWNPLFLEAIATGMAAKLVLALASDDKLFAQLDKLAYGDAREERRGGMIRSAINSDQFTKPNKRLRMGNNPLTAAYLS